MIIKTENRDLFTVPQGYYLAHCISADFVLGAGIAKQFCENFNMKEKLNYIYPLNSNICLGDALLIDNVFNLVTKLKCYHKPTYENLKNSLCDMKDIMHVFKVTKIAMPKIASGLDGLDWEKVLDIITEVFEDTDFEILVCTI